MKQKSIYISLFYCDWVLFNNLAENLFIASTHLFVIWLAPFYWH